MCRSRVRVALALPDMEHTRQAFAAGEVSACRVRLLVSAREAAPEMFSRDEALLVAQACSLPAHMFPRAIAHWRGLADADGALADAGRAFH